MACARRFRKRALSRARGGVRAGCVWQRADHAIGRRGILGVADDRPRTGAPTDTTTGAAYRPSIARAANAKANARGAHDTWSSAAAHGAPVPDDSPVARDHGDTDRAADPYGTSFADSASPVRALRVLGGAHDEIDGAPNSILRMMPPR